VHGSKRDREEEEEEEEEAPSSKVPKLEDAATAGAADAGNSVGEEAAAAEAAAPVGHVTPGPFGEAVVQGSAALQLQQAIVLVEWHLGAAANAAALGPLVSGSLDDLLDPPGSGSAA
jgi:hypothetical protein